MFHSVCRILTLPACLGLLAGCSPIQWERSYEQGLETARLQRRRALVHVHSNVSLDSRQMDMEVFTDPEVQKLMDNFVPIRLDQMMHHKIVEQLGVQVVPTFFVVRPDRSISGSHAGKLNAERFRVFLIRNLYD